MSRETILKLIEANHDRLRSLGVRELALFGSFARGEGRPDSDVDFFVDFDQKSFDRYMAVKELLEETLGRKVDLGTRASLKPAIRDAAERAVRRAAQGAFQPVVVDTPITYEVEFTSTSEAVMGALTPGAERTTPRTVRVVGDDALSAWRALFTVILMGWSASDEVYG